MSNTQQGIAWFVVHVMLGFLILIEPISGAVWIMAILVGAIVMSLRDRNHFGHLHLAVCYLGGYEVFSRMGKAPLPWELGRYAGIPLLLMGILMGGTRRAMLPGLLLAALIAPSLLLVDYSRDIRDTVVFNWSGAFVLALSVAYFNRRVLLEDDVLRILRAFAGPAVSVAVASTLKTPELANVEFTLGSMRETTGFGANQVATVYGLGIMVIALGFFLNKPIFGWTGIDFGVSVYFFFRALISFSRGGLISGLVAVIGALAILLWAYFRHQESGQITNIRKFLLIPVLVPVLAVIFVATDQLTGGLLALRYSGQTGSTMEGRREMSLTVLTTGRSDIVSSDLAMWYDHPFFGVGPGNSKILRPQYGHEKVAAHTEFSRLLAEHGVFGLIFCIVILYWPLRMVLNPKRPVIGRAVLAAFTLFSLTVMAHSATRLFVTTLVYGIGWAMILPRDVLLRIAAKHPVLRRRLMPSEGLPQALSD